MNVLKLEQREEVISFIEKQLKEQHDFAKDNIDPVKRCSSHYFIILFSNILNKMPLVFLPGIGRTSECDGYYETRTEQEIS